MTTTYRIAVIPGDGIGKEVVPEGVRVLTAAHAGSGWRSTTAELGAAVADAVRDSR
ncbi:tartrate dehydrogenase/decarboxylase / D-malate dehydrogenase [Saccharopolyspora shandongensis]|uniref:Tartrate dehydrogenase/decarboxylase / D-malate dehydrogenase n=1 Tax=Saccharopolyspora shandongensis TaxID=418495 RepID=A0A1H3DMX4_9PSEU|nr:isocitrate/isopropylmalate family dehydrogenase [Saccharopolyspora shandongensis]SDX67741.1 tartrate dehydrogenase/decarboxylase / D-malate dehydrogenase [Saccharopolyspora shandongensis]